MATKKDLVEAYAFSRRRLVTAFISGAPGGREVEPSRPGRTIVGGLALAVLVIAGAAVTGVFKPRVDGDWTEPGLVTSKEKATDYLIMDTPEGEEPVLRPLINITSAQLIYDADVEATRVPEEDLKTLEVGPPIGILNAPATPPDADDLIQDGWTACTVAGHGIKVDVSESDSVTPSPGVGFLVQSEGDLYVIAESGPGAGDPRAYRYPVRVSRQGISDTELLQLSGSASGDAVEVAPEWLGLFPPGGPIDARSLGLGPIGEPASYAGRDGIPGGAKVGDYYVLGGTTYALGEAQPVALSSFAAAVLVAEVGQSGEITPGADLNVELNTSPAFREEAFWPEEPLLPPSDELCAQLTPDAERPAVHLAQTPVDEATAADVDNGEIEQHVASGAGAFVHSASWDNDEGAGEAYLIDSRGQSYLLQGPDVPERLGYDAVDPPIVPDEWVKLFDQGVTLSVAAAQCPPAQEGRDPCE